MFYQVFRCLFSSKPKKMLNFVQNTSNLKKIGFEGDFYGYFIGFVFG